MGLRNNLNELKDKEIIARRVSSETDEYPPPVIYEITPKWKREVRSKLGKGNPATLPLRGGAIKRIIEGILTSNDSAAEKFEIMQGAVYEWWNAQSSVDALVLSTVAHIYGDEKTAKELSNLGKRNFMSMVKAFRSMVDSNPLVALAFLSSEVMGLPAPLDKVVDDYLERAPEFAYPGREAILREATKVSFQDSVEYWRKIHSTVRQSISKLDQRKHETEVVAWIDQALPKLQAARDRFQKK